ncbi:MAG: MAPEG family protein [Pseudomonadota bacterium]
MGGTMLQPILALIIWTMVMWVWMYATRIPAMSKAGIDAGAMKEKSEMEVLPRSVRQIADNYNHLHEQPVLFYALAFYCHAAGTGDALNVNLAWGYVALRIAHSIFQSTVNFIPARFALFVLASLCLFAIAVRNLI